MIECLIWLLIYVLIAVLVVYIIEQAVGALYPLPGKVWQLLRLIVALLVLLYGLQCLMGHGLKLP